MSLQLGRCPICYWGRVKKELQKKTKRLGQGGNDAQFLMYLVVQVKARVGIVKLRAGRVRK